jgi:hypothetical protein
VIGCVAYRDKIVSVFVHFRLSVISLQLKFQKEEM